MKENALKERSKKMAIAFYQDKLAHKMFMQCNNHLVENQENEINNQNNLKESQMTSGSSETDD